METNGIVFIHNKIPKGLPELQLVNGFHYTGPILYLYLIYFPQTVLSLFISNPQRNQHVSDQMQLTTSDRQIFTMKIANYRNCNQSCWFVC